MVQTPCFAHRRKGMVMAALVDCDIDLLVWNYLWGHTLKDLL